MQHVELHTMIAAIDQYELKFDNYIIKLPNWVRIGRAICEVWVKWTLLISYAGLSSWYGVSQKDVFCRLKIRFKFNFYYIICPV